MHAVLFRICTIHHWLKPRWSIMQDPQVTWPSKYPIMKLKKSRRISMSILFLIRLLCKYACLCSPGFNGGAGWRIFPFDPLLSISTTLSISNSSLMNINSSFIDQDSCDSSFLPRLLLHLSTFHPCWVSNLLLIGVFMQPANRQGICCWVSLPKNMNQWVIHAHG